MTEATETTTIEGFDEAQFEKPVERKLIDRERQIYLDKGGTIKKYIPPFVEDNYYECDIFIPGDCSIQSEPGIKDTMERKPRPEKKFGKR